MGDEVNFEELATLEDTKERGFLGQEMSEGTEGAGYV